MSNRYKKAVIDDVIGEGIEAEQQSQLLDIFESAMKSIAVTLAREATFHTSDFATAKQRGCEGFQLRLDRLQREQRVHRVFTQCLAIGAYRGASGRPLSQSNLE